MKLTEKIFIIYDDARAAQRSKKRSHSDDKEKDKDSKKAKLKDDGHKNDKEANLSPDKVSYGQYYFYKLLLICAQTSINNFFFSCRLNR